MSTRSTGTPGQSAEDSGPFRDRDPVDEDQAVGVLLNGELEILGRMPWSSNGTFLVDARRGADLLQGVYKPARGERILHDFPPGLYRREAAAYELARCLGWAMVPPTVVREGPLGEGSVQLLVPCNYEEHYFTLQKDPRYAPELIRLAAFDLVANNTDRKAGHVLAGSDGQLWAVDNALCFHHQFKIRTVIWDFAGSAIPETLLTDLQRLVERGVPESLVRLLDTFETDAILTRARALLDTAHLPADPSGHRIPWPLL
ncbi:MAG: SCO1664 family protein [Actinomycetota bacterium]|nr:SCO1664 family protein [Actinomycetota bacterium]